MSDREDLCGDVFGVESERLFAAPALTQARRSEYDARDRCGGVRLIAPACRSQ
jgi:hypothetical protein